MSAIYTINAKTFRKYKFSDTSLTQGKKEFNYTYYGDLDAKASNEPFLKEGIEIAICEHLVGSNHLGVTVPDGTIGGLSIPETKKHRGGECKIKVENGGKKYTVLSFINFGTYAENPVPMQVTKIIV